jgi:hypothetical protein
MSSDLIIGLFCLSAALLLMLRRTRGRWYSHVGVLFVLAAFVFHGVSEVVQMLWPGRNMYRRLVSQDDVDAWVAVVGFALLLFAGAYCLALRNPRRTPYDPIRLARWAKHNLPNWQLMAVLALLVFWVSVCGQDFGYWINGISLYTQKILIVIFSVGWVLKSGPRSLLPVLLILILLSSLFDSRTGIVINAIALLSIVGMFKVPISWRQMLLLGGMGVGLMVLLSSARAASGRLVEFAGSATIADRAQWLMGGLDVLTDPTILTGAVANDFVYRCDGNAFGGMVHRRLADGCPTAGLQSFWLNFVLVVPSFLYPDKISDNYNGLELQERYRTVIHYGLPDKVDLLAGTTGMIYTYYGSIGLWLIMIFLGWAYARIDGWLAEAHSIWAILMGLGFIEASVIIESNVQGYFLTFRSIFAFYALCQGMVWLQRLSHRAKQPSRNKAPLLVSNARKPAFVRNESRLLPSSSSIGT